jgi:hypothetical protein
MNSVLSEECKCFIHEVGERRENCRKRATLRRPFPVHKPAFIALREGLEVGELLEDSLLGDPVLVDEAADGDHGKAGVLDLGKAVLLEGGLVLGKAEGIESEVSGLTLALEGLEKSNNAEDLNEGDPEDDLGAASLLHEVVVRVNGSHLREEGEGVLLLNEEAKNGKHGEAAVLELGLAKHAEVEHVGEALSVHIHQSSLSTVPSSMQLRGGAWKKAFIAQKSTPGALSGIRRKK